MDGWVPHFRRFLPALFFVSTLWLSLGLPSVFASPDENANAAFASGLVDHGTFCIPEPLNTLTGGIVRPRSTVTSGDCVLPGSFLGLPTGPAGLVAGLTKCFPHILDGLIGTS